MIEQWILTGGSTLVFLDPYAETEIGLNPGMPPLNPRSDLKKLINTWGIEFDNKKSAHYEHTVIVRRNEAEILTSFKNSKQ